jgi:DNA repair protein RadA/Sms
LISCRDVALYVTGEESLTQVALRAKRLGLELGQLSLLTETHLERIVTVACELKPYVIVIDSIQTMYTDLVTSAPGSVSQVRESAAALVQFAKQTGVAVFIVGHVTKEGALAGPRVLEHMVDSVLYFEGQTDNRYRVLRAVKNRFGAVNELGVFAMTDRGLKGVNNPSAIFLANLEQGVAGSAILVTWEGSRPLLIEMQALLDDSRRICVGLDPTRLSMLLAVLHRHGGVATYNQDVFINVVGGMKIHEPAADLVALLAIYSSLHNQALPADLVSFGEVGVGGEIRPVQSGQERLREAAKLGFTKAIIPQGNAPKGPVGALTVFPVANVQDALSVLRDWRTG